MRFKAFFSLRMHGRNYPGPAFLRISNHLRVSGSGETNKKHDVSKQMWRVVRLTSIILLACTMTLSAKTVSQTITYSGKNVKLENLFLVVKQQTGYLVTYNPDNVKTAEPLDIDVNNEPLISFMNIILKNRPFDFTIEGNTVFIKKKSISADLSQRPIVSPPVTGIIRGTDGQPLAGVNIVVKGTKRGTTTDNDGRFRITADEGNILIISAIGIESFEVTVGDQKDFVLTAKEKADAMQEVIVRKGYYDEKKATTTGNVSTISSKDIEKQPVNNPLLAMQARVPGIEVYQATGLPGSAVSVQIRGRNSISNGNTPLYVIDGVPYATYVAVTGSNFVLGGDGSASPFSFINPADIESIDVLKDADATAIYGSRGANGVILVTTKKGKAGRTKVELNIQTGIGQVGHKINLLNTRQYLDMRYEAFKNDGAFPNPNVDYDLTLWDTARYTDWQKKLIGGNAYYNDWQLTASGGNQYTQFLIGGTYHKETTVFPGDFNDQKASVHFNFNNVSPDQKFRMQLSGNYVYDDNNLTADLTQLAITLPPNAPAMYNEDGTINWAPNNSGVSSWPDNTPAAMMTRKFRTKTNNLVTNLVVGYQLLPQLEFKNSFGYNHVQSAQFFGIPFSSLDPATWTTATRNASFYNGNTEGWIIEPQLNYSFSIAKGVISALLGSTIQQNSNNSQSLSAFGFNSDLVLEDITAASFIKAVASSGAKYKYNAVFARVNYNWQDKYLINLTGRRDGTSRFAPANQFHNFGAVGLGWLFSKEKFVSSNVSFFSFGKLRASYGTTGSDQVGDYSFMDLYSPVTVGVPYFGVPGLYPTRIHTPDLAWEETRKLEAAIELGFLNDRIILSSSFYRNRSTNQLINFPLPAITGFTQLNKNLDALVQNIGWEFAASTINIQAKSFLWNSSFNFTLNRNKLRSVPGEVAGAFERYLGRPLNPLFLYRYTGVDPVTGLYQVLDGSGKPTTNPNPGTDATVTLDLTPKFYGGFQNTFSYKNFQLDFLLQFVKKPYAKDFLYNYLVGLVGTFSGGNQPVTVLDRWQKPGDVALIQRFSQNSSTLIASANARQSNFLYESASYIKLKNLSISYQFPNGLAKKIHMEYAKVYLHGQNLLTFTKYHGFDPEFFNSGINLPPLRVITAGIQLTF
jgi:TonB-linked SusC/RagA family outer membrane protein